MWVTRGAGSAARVGASRSTRRMFLQANYTPYEGDDAFLAGATERTTRLWARLTAMFRGSASAASTTSTPHTPADDHRARPGLHRPGQRADRRPADRRAAASARSCPTAAGGWSRTACETYGYELDPPCRGDLHQVPQDPQRRRLRRLPAASPRRPPLAHHHRPARRLRPRPDHRRLPPRRPVRRRRADRRRSRLDKAALDAAAVERGRHPRPRGARRADPGAGRAARRWPPPTASTSPARPRTAREAVQWLYFAYLAAVKEQNGAAMSLGRTSTFLDVYLRARPRRGPARPRPAPRS